MEYKKYLLSLLQEKPISKILEIGVYRGDFAVKMLETVRHKSETSITYVGIDLFELMNDEILKNENSLIAPSMRDVEKSIKDRCPYANITLYQGFSVDILPNIDLSKFDLIYVDGGHSVITINEEWKIISKNITDNCIVVFDDYYEGRTDIGAKIIVDNIDKNLFFVNLSNGKEYDTEIGHLVVKQAFIKKKTRFDKSNLNDAKKVILECLDNQERDWNGETQKIIQLISPFLQKNTTVLDFGCGVGRLTFPIAERVKYVYGVDKSNEMLLLAKQEILNKNMDNVKFISLETFLQAEKLDIDFIICVFVLQHINKEELAIILNKFTMFAEKKNITLFVINTPNRFVVNANDYFDDGLNIKDVLNNLFEFSENVDIKILGNDVANHHFSSIYKISKF